MFMRKISQKTQAVSILALLVGCLAPAVASADDDFDTNFRAVQVGLRPHYLISKMSTSPLKTRLE